MNAREHYQAGQLREAIAAQNEEIKKNPSDVDRRGFLCELLVFAGNLDRADVQLDAMSELDAKAALGVAMFRHLVRAEQARQQFFGDGRLPEFIGQPTDTLKLALQAAIALREGRAADALQLVTQAEETRPKLSGTCDGKPFTDFRDLDDLTASFFEVLTSNGKYYWVPFESVQHLELRPPARPRDLVWRRASMVVHDGPDGEIYLPCLYPTGTAVVDDRVRLGRATEWQGGEGGQPVRGLGLRTFLVGEEDRTVLQIQDLSFGG